MKKVLTVLALLAMVAILSSQVWARGPRGGGAWAQATPEQRQQFLDETADLRQQVKEKQASLNTLIAEDADPAEIGTLQKDIYRLRQEIRDKAGDAGIQCPMGGPGSGMGCGHGCAMGGKGRMGGGGGMGMGRGSGMRSGPASTQ